ncbi:CvpA family protein [Thermoflavimicrobium daqui]|nr:CvpA family protein [Thermoflavimicrobium daqui]
MNLFDILIIVLFVFSCIFGYRKGLFTQVFSLVSWILAIGMAYLFTDEFAPIISHLIGFQNEETLMSLLSMDKLISSVTAFLILFVGAKLILGWIGFLLRPLFRLPVLSLLNQSSGLILGAIKISLLLIIIVNLLYFLPWTTGQRIINESLISQGILEVTPSLTEMFKALFLGQNT